MLKNMPEKNMLPSPPENPTGKDSKSDPLDLSLMDLRGRACPCIRPIQPAPPIQPSPRTETSHDPEQIPVSFPAAPPSKAGSPNPPVRAVPDHGCLAAQKAKTPRQWRRQPSGHLQSAKLRLPVCP